MKRKRKKPQAVPQAKRMKRSQRLQSAVSWLKKFTGQKILRSYCKHYGVDWRCAAVELQQLGVKIDPAYLKSRELAEKQLVIAQQRRHECDANGDPCGEANEYGSLVEAYQAEDYVALYAMECARDEQARHN